MDGHSVGLLFSVHYFPPWNILTWFNISKVQYSISKKYSNYRNALVNWCLKYYDRTCMSFGSPIMLVIDRIRSEAYFVPQLDISIGPSLAWLRTVKASVYTRKHTWLWCARTSNKLDQICLVISLMQAILRKAIIVAMRRKGRLPPVIVCTGHNDVTMLG